ncbi:MAG: hypothetical protein JL50_03150 [Peptococcaceae bacterium BICA1-7]|nr:MAG: hypothetical protein JL50_03150 [Peptococcaceae bacterium BICA1-7]HBV97738.1 helix-turn-helix domain-containing protein [Desulfotomaculum sp.]
MYCQECGSKAPENAKFCPECGRKMPNLLMEDRPKRVFTVQTALKDYFQGAIGLTKFREAIRKGQIPHMRIGTRIIIREEALDKWMEGQEKQSIAPISKTLQVK